MIDLYAGLAICLFLEAYEKIRRLYANSASPPSDIKKILITKYLGMGSILLATPMLRALRTKFPLARIVFLTFDSNARFTRQIPLIDEVISIRTSSFYIFALDLIKNLFKIRKEKFDVVFDLEFFARFSTIVSYLSSAKSKIGYYLPKLWRGDLLTYPVHFNPHKHVTEIFAAQLNPIGITVDDYTLTPPVISNDKLSQISSLLKEKGVKDNEFIISVNVNASDLSTERRWPKESFVELISTILENKNNSRIILVGSKNESAYVKEVYSLFPQKFADRIMNLSGYLDIDQFIALLKKSDLFITNDSGPLHIAAALGTSTVSFFGPESPSLYGPPEYNNRVFYAGIYCSPCLNVYNAKTAMCGGDNICMKEIKPSDVISALKNEGIL